MKLWARRGLRVKLFIALASVLVGLSAVTLAALQLGIESHTRATLERELAVTESVFHRSLAERRDLLIGGGRLLAGDFALKRAVATYDPDTLGSVAVNYQRRIGVDLLWVTDERGQLLADSRGAITGERSLTTMSPVAETLASGQPAAAIADLDGKLFQLVCVPVLGPERIGLLILGAPLDDAAAAVLQQSTGSQVSFARGRTLLAASWAGESRAAIARLLPIAPGPAALTRVDGVRYLSLAVPIAPREPEPIMALVQRSYDDALGPLVALRRRILLVSAASLASALLIAIWLANGLDAPIQTLVAGMRRIVQGDLAHRVAIEREDELGFLARSFNHMTAGLEDRERELSQLNADLERRVHERTAELEVSNRDLLAAQSDLETSYAELKAAQGQLVQSEKLASLGVLVAGVAHEINNPVTFIVNSIPPLKDRLTELRATLAGGSGLTPAARSAAVVEPLPSETAAMGRLLDEIGELVELMEEGAVRTAGIVKDLRSFSRLSDDRSARTNVKESLEVTLRLLRPRWAGRIEIHNDLADLPSIDAAAGQLQQVLMNLLANACDAIAERGNIWLTTRLDGDQIEIAVRDDGEGIAPADLGRIFDPFFTTKPQGKGTGLGLAIAHGIVTSHGGRIQAESAPGQGTTMRLTLPLRRPVARPGTHDGAGGAQEHE